MSEKSKMSVEKAKSGVKKSRTAKTSKSEQADDKMRVLADIASRQQLIRRRRNNLQNIFIVIASLVLVAVLYFGIMLLLADKKHTIN